MSVNWSPLVVASLASSLLNKPAGCPGLLGVPRWDFTAPAVPVTCAWQLRAPFWRQERAGCRLCGGQRGAQGPASPPGAHLAVLPGVPGLWVNLDKGEGLPGQKDRGRGLLPCD